MIKEVEVNLINFKEGVAKSGRPYELAVLETPEGRMSLYLDKEWGAKKKEIVEKWSIGDKVMVDVTTNGDFVNFDVPSKNALFEQKIEQDLEQGLSELENRLAEKIFDLAVRMDELEKLNTRLEKIEEIFRNAQKKNSTKS